MDIWLDTIDLDLIEKAQEMGVLRGVTTNPSILSEARDPQARLREVLATQGGPLATQVTSRVPEEMITQGKELSEISDRIIVKVLVNSAGLRAIARLKKEGIQVLGTAVEHPRQGFMAVEAGADWIAPYYSWV